MRPAFISRTKRRGTTALAPALRLFFVTVSDMWHPYGELTRTRSAHDRDCAAITCHDIEWDDHRWNGCAFSSRACGAAACGAGRADAVARSIEALLRGCCYHRQRRVLRGAGVERPTNKEKS